ncbi:Predicted gene 11032 [Apodemus speciosus]|uniref:Predicted gene 11032 n=1 Tax=Apodemus speciosus TaxID=105296 RepID=A0ABQ0ES53_APOSI
MGFSTSTILWGRMRGGELISLCSPGCPGTHSVDQAGLELSNHPVSASQELESKVI